MNPSEIRATVGSFWLNSLETELLGCIALALADISESLHDIRRSLAPTISTAGSSGGSDGPREEHVVARDGWPDRYPGVPPEMRGPGSGEQIARRPPHRRR
jgi:hypothetical protein